MRKGKLAVVLAIAALLALASGGAYWWRQRAGRLAQAEPGAQIEQPPAALPSVALQVNAADQAKIQPGFPLLLRVRLANPRAINAAVLRRLDDEQANTIREQMSRGTIPKEKAEKMLAALTGEPRVGALTLPEGMDWGQLMSFRVVAPGGEEQPAWKTSALAPEQPLARALDAEQEVELNYGVAPEGTASLAPGEYRLIAVLDSPRTGPWQQRMVSLPVTVLVVEGSSHLDIAEEERLQLGAARYSQAVHNPAKAMEHVQKALAAQPHSVVANMVLGELKEDAGDLVGALEAYQHAMEEYNRQRPKAQESHQYLTMKTGQLMHKLAQK